MEQTVRPISVARKLAGALMTGVVLFWFVVSVLTRLGQTGTARLMFSPGVAFVIWVAIALPGFVGALSFRGRALGVSERPASRGRDLTMAEMGEVQTNLVIAWALLEGPAILSGVFFLQGASQQLLWAAVPVYLIGMFITFPRAEWFREARHPHVEMAGR